MNGSTAAFPFASHATVSTSKFLSFSSSRSSCQTGRSNRQLHQEAQKRRKTFLPWSSERLCDRPARSGSVKSGACRDVRRLFHSQPAGPKYQIEFFLS